jgi:hypothetical protein
MCDYNEGLLRIAQAGRVFCFVTLIKKHFVCGRGNFRKKNKKSKSEFIASLGGSSFLTGSTI